MAARNNPGEAKNGAEEPVNPEETVLDPAANTGISDEVIDYIKDAVLGEVQSVVDQSVLNARSQLKTISGDIEDDVQDLDDDDSDENIRFSSTRLKSRPHAFVVMPFGTKEGFNSQIHDFNAIYNDLIRPALEMAGFEAFRADEETVSGDILTDMFQELLLADLVICDMSIDNANVFYELGVRHAFRKRGLVHIQSGRAYMPFDIFNVRTIPYQINSDGVPDPMQLEKDRQAIARVARDTWASDRDAVHSPIFNLLTGLIEPDRSTLRTPLATGFWREYNEWRERVTVAQRQKRIGDILLLTEEISNPLIKEEAVGEAGTALRSMDRHELALQQYRHGLEINPSNSAFRRQEAFHLNRLGRVDEAIVKLENILDDSPSDTEAIGYLGRIYKDMWMDSWKGIEDKDSRLAEAFDAYHWLIKSYDTYLAGYRYDLNEYYPGVNALTLAIILDHLAELFELPEDPDPDIVYIRDHLEELQRTLEFALETRAKDDKSDYWTLVSLAELRVTSSDSPRKVVRAYRKALTAARKNVFFLQSSLYQLEMLKSLDIRPDFVDVAIEVISDEIQRIRKQAGEEPQETANERGSIEQVFLFSGHMIDESSAVERRFPETMEATVSEHILDALRKFEADDNDLAFTAGASAGSEIVFIESCLQLSLRVEVHLPYSEARYIKRFIAPAGDSWVERFYQLRNHPRVDIRLQEDHVGKPKDGDNSYERNNRWTMYSSLLKGIDRVRLIAVWDGKTGRDLDGRLVSNMVAQMRHMGGIVEHLNTTKFEFWGTGMEKVGKALDVLSHEINDDKPRKKISTKPRAKSKT
jgi:tetratricopeptide (TPR) repeat protein